MMNNLELYTYCKSSAAYRVRIALNLKKISYKPLYVSLINDGGENYKPEYRKINPQAMVPALNTAEGVITQSTAIIEWLEDTYPQPALLPASPAKRACARSYAQMIACDIHPLNNLRVLDYIKSSFNQVEQATLQWYRHWINEGFKAIESRLASSEFTGDFCVGESPGYAEAYLVPQVYNAKRFQCDLEPYPLISAINERCMAIDAFKKASPELQDDFVK